MSLRPLDSFGDDEPHAAPFNLGHQLMSERRFIPEFGEPRHLEVVTLSGEAVSDVRTLAPGESFEVGPKVGWWRRLRYRDIPRRRRLVQVTHEGAWVHLDGVCGTLMRDGKRQRLDVAGDVALLRPGDVVHLFDGDEIAHHIRFATPPRRPPTPSRRITERLRAICWPAWGISLGIHLIALVAIALFFDASPFNIRNRTGSRPVDIQLERDTPPGILGLLAHRNRLTGYNVRAHTPDDNFAFRLRLGDAGVIRRGRGDLRHHQIQYVVDRHKVEIARCYRRGLLETPKLSGMLRLEWTIRTDGRVHSTHTSYTTLDSTEITACLLRAVDQWRFPRPRGGEVTVNYPFDFEWVSLRRSL